jgi:putative transposase
MARRALPLSKARATVRRWVLKFGPVIGRNLRRRRVRPNDPWHLDETVVRIAGRRMYLWRAVDHEGEVLDMLVQRRCDTRAALRLMRKLLRKQGFDHRQTGFLRRGVPAPQLDLPPSAGTAGKRLR